MSAPHNCALCPLHVYRKNIVNGLVIGEGPHQLLVIGEGPGSGEDTLGLPFVGPSGELLKQELNRRGIFSYAVTNATRCYPGENKKDSEMDAGVKACNPFLLEDIHAIRPKVILTLGAYATHSLGFDDPMDTILCHTLEFEGVPVVVSYHPAYFMRFGGAIHLFDVATIKVAKLLAGLPLDKVWPPQLLSLEAFKNSMGRGQE